MYWTITCDTEMYRTASGVIHSFSKYQISLQPVQ